MPMSLQKICNSSVVKFLLLSVMMLCGTPKWKMTDLMKFMDVRVVELVIGTALIHFVNLSTATRRWVRPPLEDFFRGPTMLSPQVAKVYASGIIFSSEAGACGLLANFWHATQRRTMSSALRMAVG